MNQSKKSNRLHKEKSPYLLQHAENPVDWYPWGDEAFAKARQENKPIFLSIGYSTCHWCHVMEKESFVDAEVAQVLNAFFVAIKVDREERPDIDHIYMQAAQAMTGRGGWPLTVLMDPDGKPFYAATYLPKVSRGGVPGLIPLLEKVADLWQEAPQELTAAGEKLVTLLQESAASPPGELDASVISLAWQSYRTHFDPEYGGFSPAPKFPSPQNLLFLLSSYAADGDPELLNMVTTTLDAMACGGMYDHIGFGFSRYATDERWLIPHFEKMLYDNALLILTYLEAYQASGSPFYKQIAEEIITYVLRDMTSPEGAFYSAEDADSEGQEGLYYTWTPQEVSAVLGEDDGARFCEEYNITESGHLDGRSIPNRVGKDPIDAADPFWLKSRTQLLQHRKTRIHPFKDDKILTGWNGLMLAALARAARVLDRPEYLHSARQAWNFIHSHLYRSSDGRLLARYRDGEAGIPAYLDDYAYLTWGLLEMFAASSDPDFLDASLQLTEEMIQLFSSPSGAFYLYGEDQEALILRPVHLWDGALPSGNSTALYNLLRLSRITGRSDWDDQLERLLAAYGTALFRQPLAHAFALTAYQYHTTPGEEVVVVLPDPDQQEPFLQHLHSQYRPFATAFSVLENDPRWETLSPWISSMQSRQGKPTAYLCRNRTCSQPLTSVSEFADLILTQP